MPGLWLLRVDGVVDVASVHVMPACKQPLRRPSAQHNSMCACPATGRFQAKFDRCKAEFDAACIGPAHGAAGERLSRAQRRESARFVRDYNDRIFNGLVIACLADILVFRFLVRISLMETVGWVAFAFLQARSSPLAGLL